jgi:uncharacterized protein involved in response to NO
MSMPAALERRRAYRGPALFSYGFRPFFLAAAAWSAVAIALWLPQLLGLLTLPTAFNATDWHVHEMLFGYVAGVIAGFLLTAIPNWTGRLPVTGSPLAMLSLVWLAGRAAVLFSTHIGAAAAAVIDISFLALLGGVAVREIVAGRNWRNLRVLGLLVVLIVANVLFHAEAMAFGHSEYGARLGIAAVVGLIMLIGGRIVPSFTHNWLARREPGRLPRPFSRYDALTLTASAVALGAWVVAPDARASGAALLAAALLQGWRLARWAGERTVAERLVLILHIAYAFVPLGFALLGASALWPTAFAPSAGVHAWTAGAMGTMTLAVMTRASLGHTGQALTASAATQGIYLCVLTAAATRVAAALLASAPLMHLAALAWMAAFAGFVLVYGPLLIGRPPAWANRES